MLKVGHINVRSLLSCFNDIKDHISSCAYDIFAITETWLSHGIADNTIYIDGYQLIRQDRPARGGGVALYIRTCFEYNICLTQCLEYLEHIWISVIVADGPLLIGIIYRPPNTSCKDFFSEFEDTLLRFYTTVNKILCLGDFNINFLNDCSANTKTLINILETFSLSQFICEPTRLTRYSESTIDLICYNSDLKINVEVRDINIADHFLTRCTIPIQNEAMQSAVLAYRDLKKINLINFQRDLEAISWNDVYCLNTVDDKVNFVSSNLTTLLNKHAPLRLRKGRNNKPCSPWFTENLRLLKRLRSEALDRFRYTHLPEHWEYYKRLRNTFTAAYRAEKKAYLNFKFQNCTSKEKWAELKRINVLNKKQNLIPAHLKNLNKINSHFVNAANSNVLPKPDLLDFYKNNKKINHEFQFSEVAEEMISNIILKMKSTAVGSDNINSTFLILCCPFIIPYLTHLINCCLRLAVFPSAWKSAIVMPLPKVSQPDNYGQLRSISILPTMSKILEKVMAFQISGFAASNDLLPEKQSGFRRGHSCTTALADVTDGITGALDEGKASVLVLLDYSRAFDLLNYDILLSILSYNGFGLNAQSLIKSFLSNRTQKVTLDGQYSSAMSIYSGVPQGSVLGPLLFTMYTANFINSFQFCDSHLYADDTQILYSFRPESVAEANFRINSDLQSLFALSQDHLLQLNPLKSVALLFCNEKVRQNISQDLSLTIGNSEVSFKSSSKNLGLIMDNKLKFNEHITSCIKKSYSAIKSIFPHRHCLDKQTKVELCEALVLSHFNFADSIYGPYLDTTEVRRVQRVQNSCIRFICGIRRRQHVSHKLRELNWLSMYNRRVLHSACFFYNIIKNQCPIYLHKKVVYRTDIHNLNIRRRHILTVPKHNKELFKKGFSYNIASTINKFEVCQFNTTVSSFKKGIRQQLLQ